MNVSFDPSLIVKFWQGAALPAGGRHVLIACMPKSGSTWLRRLVEALPEMYYVDTVPGWDHREQELATDLLSLWHGVNWVSQNHIRWSKTTERMLQAFAIHPVVLVRNVFDLVPSIADHYRKEGVEGASAFVWPGMAEAPPETAWEFIVDMVVPWYFNFYLTWRSSGRPALWVSYEQLRQEPRRVLADVVQFCRLSASPADIDKAVAAVGVKSTRLNRGETGRGQALPESLRDRIRHYASYYPDTDFSAIGLPKADGAERRDRVDFAAARASAESAGRGRVGNDGLSDRSAGLNVPDAA